MTIDTLIMFSGAFVLALPLLGFPASWDAVLLVLAGIATIALGIAVRRRGLKPRGTHLEKNHVFRDVSAPAQPAALSNDASGETAL